MIIKKKSKLNPKWPFQVFQKINDNTYRLDLSPKYGVHPTITFCYLTHFVGTTDYEEDLNLRTDPLQEGGSNRGSSKKLHIRPLTRSVIRRMEEEDG